MDERRQFFAHENDLFAFDEVGDVTGVVDPAHLEARAGALGAEAGDDSGFSLARSDVDCANFDAAAHGFEEPVVSVDVVSYEWNV